MLTVVVVAAAANAGDGRTASTTTAAPTYAPAVVPPTAIVAPPTAAAPTFGPMASVPAPVVAAPPAPTTPALSVSRRNAVESAESYMDYSSFSRGSLIDQLEYEGFTAAQAKHGADSVGL